MTSHNANAIRQMRQDRVRQIRGRVIGYSVALFMVVWAVIAVVLVTGHDPALAHKSTGSTAATTTGSSSGLDDSAGAGSSDSTGSGSTGSSNSAGSGSSGSSGASSATGSSSPTPLTSSQS